MTSTTATTASPTPYQTEGTVETATVTGQRIKATMQVGAQTIQVNGKDYPTTAAVISPSGDVCVPVRTLGHLLVAHSGKPLQYLVRDVLP